ncbi:isopenicillin N synthase family dioxygenase [Shewanella xiamenensis]|uniref:isopenicillin N synthase family dioxygenase n=1 Tax=Shewanella TaxID=22 RepID=UPI001662944F|nr:isopenicillin N synthase family oxygenase [Shewanella xiamenensis]MCL1071495.1 isopenicillin N synthase family oxygenase [Shewanella xiamenensis]MCR4533662.1 isopenicillin N synthase family oxygenase [Shewanella xiamenensis]MDI5874075.1 isopenicillin N synthase family oxygenase [Shewanella xiamenensis]MEE1979946.1 isopenicillin N synthase family oxygenase [Shewanella xiamenensis]WHF53958.1 isopenicillin N synthase family oxygenase [Shewanella xiamenensis]
MKLETIDYRAADSAKRFVESLRETGFGVLSNHPIDKELVENIYAEWQAFFNSDAKNEFMFNRETHDGFFPASISETAKGHTVKDIKEYYHVYPWGRIPDSLRTNILAYYEKANALASELLEWIETYSPDEVKAKFSIPLPEMIADSHKTLLRILHYPPMTGDEEMGAIRAAAHEDINLITVLPAANEPGLQVKAKDGSWLDVPSDFGNIIINIGDMLQEASGGYFPSTSHRVINPEGTDKTKSRISLPLFLHPKPSVVLSERYTADSYLMERLRELGVL